MSPLLLSQSTLSLIACYILQELYLFLLLAATVTINTLRMQYGEGLRIMMTQSAMLK